MARHCLQINSSGKKELLNKEYYAELAAFACYMESSSEDPFNWVNEMFEQFYDCRSDCDLCGKCVECHACNCQMIDCFGDILDLSKHEYDDDFGEDPKATMRRLKGLANQGPQIVHGRVLKRLMWIDLARAIFLQTYPR